MNVKLEQIACIVLSIILALATIPLGLQFCGDSELLRVLYILVMIDLFVVAPVSLLLVQKRENDKIKKLGRKNK